MINEKCSFRVSKVLPIDLIKSRVTYVYVETVGIRNRLSLLLCVLHTHPNYGRAYKLFC
jgi:hypothetical protein